MGFGVDAPFMTEKQQLEQILYNIDLNKYFKKYQDELDNYFGIFIKIEFPNKSANNKDGLCVRLKPVTITP